MRSLQQEVQESLSVTTATTDDEKIKWWNWSVCGLVDVLHAEGGQASTMIQRESSHLLKTTGLVRGVRCWLVMVATCTFKTLFDSWCLLSFSLEIGKLCIESISRNRILLLLRGYSHGIVSKEEVSLPFR
jgi:hypothetical protein